MIVMHGTTIVSARRKGQVVIGGDGQVSLGESIIKSNACKVRRLYNGKVLVGFAGATADAMTLFELFEAKLEAYQGQLLRSAVEMVKDWRTDKMLYRLEATLAVANIETSLIITGAGDVLEPESGLMAIGSGGDYAKSAAKALLDHTHLSAKDIVQTSLNIAADICVYTNHHHVIECLEYEEEKKK